MKWFTSDLHLNQKNIVKNLSNWAHADPESLRDFADEQEMSMHIIDKINDYVKENDELYILGDIYFGRDIAEIEYYIRKIKCKTRHLIFGNHDYLLSHDRNLPRTLRTFTTAKHYDEIRMTYPLPGTDPNRDKWKGKQMIVISHYAMRVWNKSHHGSWMLYGHSHASLDDLEKNSGIEKKVNTYYNENKTMDVGVDNIKRLFGEYRPISFDELLTIMNNKKDIYIDHHEKHITE